LITEKGKEAMEALLAGGDVNLIQWYEPGRGMRENGSKVTVPITYRATPADCVKIQRLVILEERPELKGTLEDYKLLEEFMIVNWAHVVRAPGEATGG